MRKSFKIAQGVRVTASSRGISTRVGPLSASTRGSRTRRAPAPGPGRLGSHGPTKASIASYERELKAAQREADIEKVAALERALVSVHTQSFSRAERIQLPPIDPVEPAGIEGELEVEADIPNLLEQLGGGEVAPSAAEPEPVDRYELMREQRKRGWEGIPPWRLRDRIEAARRADAQAEVTAEAEEVRRRDDRASEQDRLDGLWTDLQAARGKVADRLAEQIAAETARLEAARAAEQAEFDRDWELLQANDPALTMAALEQAFADNDAPAAPIDCDGDRTTVLMQFRAPEEIVPERKPARTPTGKPTLKKRTKTELNALYRQALGSNVLATVKEAFAVAPGAQVVQVLVVRREREKKHAGELVAIYAGEFDRSSYDGASGSRDPGRALELATDPELNLKGKTEQIAPLVLSERPDLQAVLTRLINELSE